MILSPSGADTAAQKKLVVDVGLYVPPSPREVLVIRLTEMSLGDDLGYSSRQALRAMISEVVVLVFPRAPPVGAH